jgi:hypothetical protein
MMARADIVAGFIRAFELIARWARDAGLIRRGVEKSELFRCRDHGVAGQKLRHIKGMRSPLIKLHCYPVLRRF